MRGLVTGAAEIRGGGAVIGRSVSGFGAQRVEHTPDPLHEPTCAFSARLGPFNVALWRAVRQYEPARRISAEGRDDIVRVDDILLRLGHFLNRADRDGMIRADFPKAALAIFNFCRRNPASIIGLISLMRHHALCEQASERFAIRQVDFPDIAHRPHKETGIKQMQHSMFDTADILIHRQPIGAFRRIIDAGEARKIPAGIIERIERIGLPHGRLAAFRTVDMFPGRVMRQRIARLIETDIVRQLDRQVRFRDRHNAAIVTMNDRDRTAPIALPGHTPVAQAVIHRALAERSVFNLTNGQRFGGGDFLTIQETGIHDRARPGISRIHVCTLARCDPGRGCGILIRWLHHRQDWQVIFAGKIEVALIVRRTREDRPGAIAHQHEIRDIDG